MTPDQSDQFPHLLAAVVNEGLKLGVPPLQVAATLDGLKFELQLKMLRDAESAQAGAPLIVAPPNGRMPL